MDKYDFSDELRGEMGNGNVVVTGNGTRLVWWIIGIFGVLATSGAMAMTSAVYSLKADVAALTAKVDILLDERRPRYRGTQNE